MRKSFVYAVFRKESFVHAGLLWFFLHCLYRKIYSKCGHFHKETTKDNQKYPSVFANKKEAPKGLLLKLYQFHPHRSDRSPEGPGRLRSVGLFGLFPVRQKESPCVSALPESWEAYHAGTVYHIYHFSRLIIYSR